MAENSLTYPLLMLHGWQGAEKLPLFSSSYIQIILIQRKDKDQDIGSSTDATYAADKDYIIAEFDYGKKETFTIGDGMKYSKTGSTAIVSLF